MKLGYFLNSNVSVSETFISELVNKLSADSDFEVTVFSGQCANSVSDNQTGLDTVNVGYLREENLLLKIIRKIGLLGGRRTAHWEVKYLQHVASVHLSKLDLEKLPEVAFIEYANTAIWIFQFLEANQIPYIVHVHGFDISSATVKPGYLAALVKVFIGASSIIAASYHIRRLLVLLGCEEQKISVIRYGIDCDKIVPIPWSERQNDDPSVIFLGRLTPKKNPLALVHAFWLVKKQIPNAKLTIIGDGPLGPMLEDRISALDLETSVRMTGAISQKPAWQILSKHWIYAQHSVTSQSGDQEGFALSLAEAAAFELPVVSTMHNGIPENVINGKTGFLVKEFDYEDMAEKIIFLIRNPERAIKMGKEGRQHIKEMCVPERRLAEIKKLLLNASNN